MSSYGSSHVISAIDFKQFREEHYEM